MKSMLLHEVQTIVNHLGVFQVGGHKGRVSQVYKKRGSQGGLRLRHNVEFAKLKSS